MEAAFSGRKAIAMVSVLSVFVRLSINASR